MQSREDSDACIAIEGLPSTTWSEDKYVRVALPVVSALLHNLEFCFHDLNHCRGPRLLFPAAIGIVGIHPDDKNASLFQVGRQTVQGVFNLSHRHVVHRLAEKDHIELLDWLVVDEVSLNERVLPRSAVDYGSLPSLFESRLGNIYPDVALVGACRQLVRRVARTASQVQDASVSAVLLKVLVDAV